MPRSSSNFTQRYHPELKIFKTETVLVFYEPIGNWGVGDRGPTLNTSGWWGDLVDYALTFYLRTMVLNKQNFVFDRLSLL